MTTPPTAADDKESLTPISIFGFDGEVVFGLNLHPDGKHSIIPLGNKVVITNIKKNSQQFLIGHTNKVSCVHVSKSGKYVASGQVNHMGFRAYVILWDFFEQKELARHDLHKVRCETVAFTAEDKYVVSIGSIDDGSVIVFDVETRTPLCRSVSVNSTTGHPCYVCPLNKQASLFVAAGDRHLRLWKVEKERRKLCVQDVSCGRHQRKYTSMIIDENDENIYLGTMTGDAAHVKLCVNEHNEMSGVLVGLYGKHNPRKPIGKDCDKYVNGIRELVRTADGNILLGTGDGTVELVAFRNESFKNYPSTCVTWPMFKTVKATKVNGAVTSIARYSKNFFFIGTSNSEIYVLNEKTFDLRLRTTCHREAITELLFPHEMSTVFASAGYESIRIWSITRFQELLRIMVYNFTCTGIAFAYDGKSILSAWNDGIIRSFTPITGRLIFAITNAHNKGVSAIAISRNGKTLVSSGIEGQVRVWRIEPQKQTLLGVLKDHTGPISSLHFNHLDTEVVSAGTDGSCVIWDIPRMTRKQVICANTQFTCARYHPSGVHLVTAGSDGRISYWMVFNGSLLRELEGSNKNAVNCVSFSPTGQYFISVGADFCIKLWDYQSGVSHVSVQQHASSIQSCAFSPCGKYAITASAVGSIIIWAVPKDYWPESGVPHDVEVEKPEPPKAPDNISTGSRRSSKKEENIKEIESCSQELICAECPPCCCTTIC